MCSVSLTSLTKSYSFQCFLKWNYTWLKPHFVSTMERRVNLFSYDANKTWVCTVQRNCSHLVPSHYVCCSQHPCSGSGGPLKSTLLHGQHSSICAQLVHGVPKHLHRWLHFKILPLMYTPCELGLDSYHSWKQYHSCCPSLNPCVLAPYPFLSCVCMSVCVGVINVFYFLTSLLEYNCFTMVC